MAGLAWGQAGYMAVLKFIRLPAHY